MKLFHAGLDGSQYFEGGPKTDTGLGDYDLSFDGARPPHFHWVTIESKKDATLNQLAAAMYASMTPKLKRAHARPFSDLERWVCRAAHDLFVGRYYTRAKKRFSSNLCSRGFKVYDPYSGKLRR